MFLTNCLAVIFGLKLLVFPNYIVYLMRGCVVRCTNKRIEMACQTIQKASASFLSVTRDTDDIKIRTFYRAGVHTWLRWHEQP